MNLIYLLISISRSSRMSKAIGGCQKIVFWLTIIYISRVSAVPTLAKSTKAISGELQHKSTQKKYQNLANWLVQNNNTSCQQNNIAYQEVYSFETENFYISICQLGSNFYYYRQSKINIENSILIPAQTVFGGEVFQATNGKIIYFVGKDGDRYYSSVMLNSNEIVFEPQLPPEPLVFSPEIIDPGVAFSFSSIASMDSYNRNDTKWKLNLAEADIHSDRSPVCTEDLSAFSPDFDSWLNLLGKTADAANNYATNNGHNFVYEADAGDQAFIETKEGTIINLNIATPGNIIEQVCVIPTAINIRTSK